MLSTQDEEMEKEANILACLLLMPKSFIEEDLKEGFDLTDDTKLKELAKKYAVSQTALVFRISLLNKHKI